MLLLATTGSSVDSPSTTATAQLASNATHHASHNPFMLKHTVAFAYPGRIAAAWKQRMERVDQAAIDLGTCGVQWNEFGVTFPPSWNFSSPAMMDVVGPLLTSGPPLQREAEHVVLEQQLKPRPPLADFKGPSALQPLLASLERDGFAQFGQELGFRDLILSTGLPRRVMEAVPAANVHHEDGATFVHYLNGIEPAVERVIDTLGHVVLHYVGEGAELEGFSAFRLGSNVHTPQVRGERTKAAHPVTSALWHHDRCGRRLKAYVFLQDVTPSTHPTEIVGGSHRTTYYSYSEYFESRFDERFVKKTFNATPMLGRLGDGFIFDTNTIHRGQPGVHLEKRDVLLFEFNLRSDLRTFREKASGGEKARSCGPTAMQVNSSFSLDRIRRRHAHGQHLRKSRAAGAVGGADGIEAWTSRLRETSKTLWP